MDGVQKKQAKFIFNEYGTDGAESTIVANVIRRVEVLMIIVAVDGHVELREVGKSRGPKLSLESSEV